VTCALERHDLLEGHRAAIDQLDDAVLPVGRVERRVDDGPQLALDDDGHLAIQAVHVLEVPEHGAQADIGAGGHLLGAGRHVAGPDDLQHGRDDAGAVVLAATTAAVGFLRQFSAGFLRHPVPPDKSPVASIRPGAFRRQF
jgi:hypothetical protein